MKTKPKLCWLAAGAGLWLAVGLYAAAKGGVAFIKRADTALRTEPSAQAAETVRLKLGAKLTIAEVRGRWLRVTGEKEAAGWIFAGNVAETAPDENAGLAMVPLDASATTATAAARPLTPEAEDYGQKRNLGKAKADLEWLAQSGIGPTTAEVTTYLQTSRKGEYQ